MTERIIPDCMRAPAAVESVVADAEGAQHKTTARVENVREGMCPICHTEMVRSNANGHEVVYCSAHSLVMPVRDQEPLPINPGALSWPDTSLC